MGRLRLGVMFLIVALNLPGVPALSQTNHDPDTQKTEEPEAIKPDAKPESSTPSTREPEHSAQDRSKQEESCEYRGPAWFSGFYCFFALHDKFWVSFGTLILAIGTAILGFATVFLWRATRQLVLDAKEASEKQFKVSMLAAKAADLSAKAAIGVELPMLRAWADGLTFGRRQTSEGIYTEYCSLHMVRFVNSGRTQAIPIEIECGWTFGDSLPETPLYSFTKPFPIDQVFHPVSEEPRRPNGMQVNEFEFIASGEFSDPLRKGSKTLWFYCKLVYLDFMQVRRESGFCWRRVDNPNTHGYFVADAAPAYNQKT